MFFKVIKEKIEKLYLNKKWRSLNTNNFTNLYGLKNWERISVGKNTYGDINVADFDPKTGKSKLIIGSYCSIGGHVSFLLGGGHYLNRITTYPFLYYIYGKEESLEKGNINIGDDVWIGNEVTIMSGVTIGQGAVIGTKALVTKDIPPYAIAVGIPAKVIRYRFDKKTIDQLLRIDFSNLNFSDVKKNINVFETPINVNTIKKLKKITNK